MSQTSYNLNQVAYTLGQKALTTLSEVEAMAAGIQIPIGRAVVKTIGLDRTCRLPVANVATITIAGTYTSGTLTFVVGGSTITQAYDTDKTTTLTALAAQVAALAAVKSCTWTLGTTILLVVMKNGNAPVAADLSGFVGTASPVFASSSDEVIHGIALNDGSMVSDANGLVAYAVNGGVSVLRKGSVAVFTEEAVTSDDPVFVRFMANGAGKLVGQFRKSADTDKAVAWTAAKFKNTAVANSVVVVEINLP